MGVFNNRSEHSQQLHATSNMPILLFFFFVNPILQDIVDGKGWSFGDQQSASWQV